MWETVDSGWSERELSGVELGDKRLERRIVKVAQKLSAKPEAPINQSSEDWADVKGAYRFFDNEKLSREKILRPHQERTLERMKGEPIVLVAQDTTYLNYNESVEGLGPIGDSRTTTQGLIMHSALAVTPEGLPLGFLSQKIYARVKGYKSAKSRKKKPIELKESYRWITTLEETHKLIAATAVSTKVVTLCDRESDIYEFFVTAQKLKAPFVVRASFNRALCSEEYSLLWKMVEAEAVSGHTTVEFPKSSLSEKKQLKLEVRFSQVSLKAPYRSPKISEKLPAVTLHAVHVKETGVAKADAPVEWLLLTNLPVKTFEEALEKVAWYTRRWSIEVFHRILKSGCTVEQCQLETAERLKRYLTLMSIVAWRIFWMTHVNRTDPKAPATQVLTENELRALPLLFRKKPPYPLDKTPTVAQVVVAIARLGGFLARKGDKNPGPKAIWRGWQRLADATLATSNNTCG